MIDLSFLKEYWWIGLILLGVIILAIVIRKKKSKPKQKPITKHNWEPIGHTVVKDKLRLVFYDKTKGVAIHTPIYTMKQLNRMENGDLNE